MKPLFKYHVELELANSTILKSWGVCAVAGQSPILDGIFDPQTGHLRLLLDSTQEKIQPIELPTANNKVKTEYRKVQEYYRMIIPKEDIEAFLALYVDNNFEFVIPTPAPPIVQEAVFSERRAVEVSESVLDEQTSPMMVS